MVIFATAQEHALFSSMKIQDFKYNIIFKFSNKWWTQKWLGVFEILVEIIFTSSQFYQDKNHHVCMTWKKCNFRALYLLNAAYFGFFYGHVVLVCLVPVCHRSLDGDGRALNTGHALCGWKQIVPGLRAFSPWKRSCTTMALRWSQRNAMMSATCCSGMRSQHSAEWPCTF